MNKKKYYKKILKYFTNNKKEIIIYIITSLLIVVFNTISPALNAKNLTAITNANFNNMLKFSLLVFLIGLIEEIIRYINEDSSAIIQNDVELKIKGEVSKEIFDLELQNFDKEGTEFFVNRIEREPNNLSHIFSSFRYTFTTVLSDFGVFIYIFYINYIIGLLLLISSLIVFCRDLKRTKERTKKKKDINLYKERYRGNFGELIRGIRDIKVLNLKNVLIKKTLKAQNDLNKLDYNNMKKDRTYYIVDNFIRTLTDFLLVILGIFLIKNNYLTSEIFLIIFMYRYRASNFIGSISYAYKQIKDINLSIEMLYELIEDKKYPKEKFGNIELDNLKGNIEFKDTHFGYNDKEVLKGINFKIKANETIGIVGKSGVGKTTIFNLLNKLYNVYDNQIFIDGIDINKLSRDTLRNNISTITQNPYVFNMSIKDNLKIVKENVSDKEIEEKCKLCLLDEYINGLDNKYDTLVGENGIILSGGLKQRLCIARALIKNSKIILLDEATSSLDNESQEYIQESIKKVRKDYTILIIAHRLSTVIECDKILVVDDGKIVGFDTHDNLIKNNKIYKKLYKKELS